jgi:hypothetical protein
MQPNKEKREKTIKKRQEEQKALLLKQFETMPVLQVALDRAGHIGRTTYYNWCESDPAFRKAADAAIHEGELYINDFSESKLLSLIEKEHHPSIISWLRAYHPKYASKLKITGALTIEDEHYTPEEESDIAEALRLVGVPFTPEKPRNKSDGEQSEPPTQ